MPKQRCVDWTFFKKHHIKNPSVLGKLFKHRPQQQRTDPSRTSTTDLDSAIATSTTLRLDFYFTTY
jgi:hypothetical protein